MKTNYGYQTVSDKNESISHLDWVKIFEYDPNWQLKRVLKIDSNHTSTYLYGNHQEIGVVKHEFQLEGIVGDKYHVNFSVHNLSDSIISLRFENLPKNIVASDIYHIPGETQYDVVLNVAPETNYHTYSLDLIGENILIEFIFNTEAYHYKTSDFQDSIPLIITNRNPVIKRVNSEALLTILSKDKKKTIRQIPLNNALMQVDLADLVPGEYVFVFTDFSNNSKFMKKIKLK